MNRILKKYITLVLIIVCFCNRGFAQLQYFAYQYTKTDTVKTSTGPNRPMIKLKYQQSGYKTYIRYKNFVFEVSRQFSGAFEDLTPDETKFALGLTLPGTGSCVSSPVKSILNLSNFSMYNYVDSVRYRFMKIPQLRFTKLSNGNIKYFVNENVYFVVDPKGNSLVNPGIFAPYIRGSIVEFQNNHIHYVLATTSEKVYPNDIENLEIELKFLDEKLPKVRVSYPFLYNDSSTSPFSYLKLNPVEESKIKSGEK